MLVSPLFCLALALVTSSALSTPRPRRSPSSIPCSSIPPPEVPGAKVVDFVAEERFNVSGLVVREEIPSIEMVTGLNICNVNVSLSHRGVGDRIGFEVWLPLDGWNGRFQGVGGGGWVAGHHGTQGLGIAVEQGFAAAITDGGNISTPEGMINEDILSDGAIDMGRVYDFMSRGLHEVALVGKAITASFYGEPPHHSYWNGCSQGGRQGYELAQRYPDAFDGILANAPALYLPSFLLSMGWGEFITRWKGQTPSACVLEGFQNASIAACDELDGVLDGVISDNDVCEFDPTTLVGKQIDCGNESATVADEDAEVLRLFHEGPRSPQGTQLWKAFPWGISYEALFPEDPVSSALWNQWHQYFVKKDPDYDMASLDTLEELTDFYATAYAEYGSLISTDLPDLSALRDQGHKLLTWHGSADDMIMLDNTITYRKNVESVMGGNEAVNDFYRLYVAPGVGHCNSGNGAYPADAFESLIGWVEEGKSPEELHGTMVTPEDEEATRKMCLWPLMARYDGEGDPNLADSSQCA